MRLYEKLVNLDNDYALARQALQRDANTIVEVKIVKPKPKKDAPNPATKTDSNWSTSF